MFAHRIGTIIAGSLVLLVTLTAPVAEATCTATSLTLDDTYRDSGSGQGTMELFKVVLNDSGVIVLDVSVAGSASAKPKINFLGTDCAYTPTGEGTSWEWVRQAPTWAVVEATSSGTFYFEVGPANAEQTLGDYKLSNAFIAEQTTADQSYTPSSDPNDSCAEAATAIGTGAWDEDRFVSYSEDIDEWDRDLQSGDIDIGGIMVMDATGEDIDINFYRSSDCASGTKLASERLDASGHVAVLVKAEGHRLEIDPAPMADGSYTIDVKLYTPCDLGETDDFGNDFVCAEPIASGGDESGSVSNLDDDDMDYFVFHLDSQMTVEIETSGSTDTYGVLFDDDGAVLATDDDSGATDNFRISETLAGGEYYFRVEGSASAEGSYTVDFDASVP